METASFLSNSHHLIRNIARTGILGLMIICFSGGVLAQSPVHGTFLGGSDREGLFCGAAVLPAPDGSLYVAGPTRSVDIPVTASAYDTSYNGGSDVFIVKLTPDLTTIQACTYLGGTKDEIIGRDRIMALTATGDLVITTLSKSTDFPVTSGVYDDSHNGGNDVTVTVLTGDLTTVLSSTYIGSPGYDLSASMAISDSGEIYLCGYTRDETFPVTAGAYDETYNGTGEATFGGDIYIARFNSALTELLASTFIGGDDWEYGGHLVLNSSGDVVIAGATRSLNYPTLPGAYNTDHAEISGGMGGDAFVSRLDGSLSILLASTYAGGNLDDWGYTLALDDADNVIITGHTSSTDFPTSAAAWETTFNGVPGVDVGDDVFVSKFTPDLTTLTASTYIGGEYWDAGNSVFTGPDGDIYVAGQCRSSDFPVTSGVFQETHGGGAYMYGGDVFIARFDGLLTDLKASTFVGGSGTDGIGTAGLLTNGKLVVAGITNSEDFPVSGDACDPTYNGGSINNENGDLFAFVIAPDLTGSLAPTPTPTPAVVWYTLTMENTDLSPGDTFLLERTCGNPDIDTLTVDDYIILDVFGQYWFWPGWTETVDSDTYSLAPATQRTDEILTFIWPDVTGSITGLKFWGALLHAGSSDLIIFTDIEWGYSPGV